MRADIIKMIKEVIEQVEENRETDLLEKSHINDEKMDINKKMK